MATATQTQNRQMNGKAIQARSEAVAKLIVAHQEEFTANLTAERVARGLPAEAGGESTNELQKRLAKQREKIAKLEADLTARGVKV